MPSKTRKRENRKKKRNPDQFLTMEHKYYIFCEGEKTEPLYFDGFKSAIKKNPMYSNSVHVEAFGVAKETIRILEHAVAYVEYNQINNAEIWCVYDKDSFPDADFNEVSLRANSLNQSDKTKRSGITYRVAWSNQCIEYWFLIHFDKYDSNNDRKQYLEYLSNKYKSLGKGKYEKNDKETFNTLTFHGNPKLAIKRADQRLKECGRKTDAESAPATKVHLLVKELAKYLPEDIKNKYLDKEKESDNKSE